MYLVGDGSVLCYNMLKDLENVVLVSEQIRYNNSIGVALAAFNHYENSDYIESEKLLPSYIRLSQAQMELAEKQKKEIK